MSPPVSPPSLVTPSRVLVVDDNPLSRHGLVRLLNQNSEFTVCGEAVGDQQALAAVANATPDLVVIALLQTWFALLHLIKQLRESQPAPRILLISAYDDPFFAACALQMGAQGYILKQESPDRLLEAMRVVLSGETYARDDVIARLLRGFLES